MRLQLALNVNNLNEAISFYTKLFGAEPHKIRNGYANFSIESPPLKLVLFENPEAPERLNHLGVEVFNTEQVTAAKNRLSEGNILDEVQLSETCCHATQDKVWSREPQGLRWEWYLITDDAPHKTAEATRCCSRINNTE
ncbi:MAG: VOC family protein [Porticoccaceae bacterium]|nr:VOC family protein [Porticoccaceae bacterium]